MGIVIAPYAVEKGKNDRTWKLYSGWRGTVPSFCMLITQTETMVYVFVIFQNHSWIYLSHFSFHCA